MFKTVALCAVSAVAQAASPHIMLGRQYLASMYNDQPQQLNSWTDLTSCQYIEDYNFYDYSALAQPGNGYYTATEESTGNQIYFNMCSNLDQSDAFCQEDDAFAALNVGGTCTALSNSNAYDVQYNDSTANGASQAGIQYTSPEYADIEGCTQLFTKVNLVCNQDILIPSTSTTLTFNQGTCTYYTEVEGADACSQLSINALWEYFEEFDYLFGAVFIILGIFLTFLGRKLFLAAVFIASLVLVTIVVLALSYGTFLSDNYSEGVFWGMLSASILIGIIVGVLLVKFSRFAAFAIGAWGGYVLGLFINDLALWAVASTWLFWLVNIGCAIVCGVLAFFFFNPAIILSTAFIGSYLILRGIGMYAGGFQNEYTIVSEIQSGTSDNILWTTYAYLAGMVVVFIIGSIVQFKTLKSMSEEEKKHPYNRLA